MMVEQADPTRSPSQLSALLHQRQTVLLETRKRDGTWVGTPVSLVVEGERGYFHTWDTSGKCKRLRNFQEVRVTPSTLAGKPTAATIGCIAVKLEGEDDRRAGARLARAYPWLHGRFVPRYHRVRGWRTVHYEVRLNS